MTRVKVCGLMNRKDIDLCAGAGVHTIGFVVDFPVPVPWNLTPDEASELIARVPPFISTCVVTGGSVDKVLGAVSATQPNLVQLHYKESLKDISEIALNLLPKGIKVVKALRIDVNGKCDFDMDDPELMAIELSKTGISAILVDSYTEAMPGGTGVLTDLSVFKRIQRASTLPVILAGGLHPGNIRHIIGEVNPFAVDVLTGVEEKPGIKDASKIKLLMDGVNAANFV